MRVGRDAAPLVYNLRNPRHWYVQVHSQPVHAQPVGLHELFAKLLSRMYRLRSKENSITAPSTCGTSELIAYARRQQSLGFLREGFGGGCSGMGQVSVAQRPGIQFYRDRERLKQDMD